MRKIKINIGGKERVAKLGLGFLEQLTKSENISIIDFLKKFETETLFILPKMLFHSISYNDKIEGLEIDYKLSDVYDWVDDLGIQHETIINFNSAFAESIRTHIPNEEGKKVPQKKVEKK
ncbi:hypothetical protein [Chryseobacterium indologenes]|uniref:Uncharacterized protein n=1 Tax=Chryseobacterium indologenes TaxID=253 RepID=A0A0N0ZV74_CHRID|nr:hypothetical protein [Chryseobacterium indologenes]KPE49767.1 hypothetical protein AOB46_18765 [Chryseobacterium indologenes]